MEPSDENLIAVLLGGISGQGGGRILPGTAGGIGELLLIATRSVQNQTLDPLVPDRRPNAPLGSFLDTVFCQPGGGPGEPGKGSEYAIYGVFSAAQDGTVATLFQAGMGGGGGGWGAAGGTGDAIVLLADGFNTALNRGANPGGAGGKAINTNGHSVTWLGGSTRAYGAVG